VRQRGHSPPVDDASSLDTPAATPKPHAGGVVPYGFAPPPGGAHLRGSCCVRLRAAAAWRPPPRVGAALLLAAMLAAAALLRARAVCLQLPASPVASALGGSAPFAPHVRVDDGDAAAAGADADGALDIVYVSGLPAHLRSSLRSLCAFWRRPPSSAASGGAGGTVHVIVPDRMAAYFDAAAPALAACPGAGAQPLRLRVWRESAVVAAFAPGGAGAGASGTVKQMTLKLAAAFIVSTPFYLVMDSDVYARRPWSAADVLLRGGGSGGKGGARLRARAGLDHTDVRFTQDPSWLRESARVLGTPLVEATDAYCGVAGPGSGPWFAATGEAPPPGADATPFALLRAPGGHDVFGVCNFGRARATHVTPMVLAAAIVRGVLVPRLEAHLPPAPVPTPAAAAAATEVPAAAPAQRWVDVLLAYQARREGACWTGTLRPGRFYTWTEYGLYFVAAVAAGALDQYHTFAAGGITSLRYSMMLPAEYDAADWGRIFADAGDDAPFFIVHSWFGKPPERTDAHLAPHIPGLEPAPPPGGDGAAPSPLPLY
jgi:hypothetical protein